MISGNTATALIRTVWAILLGGLLSSASTAGTVDRHECYSNEFCVTVIDEGSFLEVKLANIAPYALTVSFDMTLENLTDEGKPEYSELGVGETVQVTQLAIIDMKKDVNYSFNFFWTPGLASNVHDDNVVYQLPFRTGETHDILQGYYDDPDPARVYSVYFSLQEGAPIFATRGGTVRFVEDNENGSLAFSNFIKIEHPDGTYGEYRNLQSGSIDVVEGQEVTTGAPLALVGKSQELSYVYFRVTSPVSGKALTSHYVLFQTANGVVDLKTGDSVTSGPDTGEGTDTGGTDTGGTDTGGTDTGGTDTGGTDTGGTDTGGTDTGGTETGGTDTGGTDTGGTDTGGTDNGGTDNGGTDNGGTDNGGTDNGGTDNGGTDTGGTDTGGTDTGGTDTGGTDNGGTDTGGTDNGGTDNGGTDNGGTDNGGTDNGGTDTGGTDTGGTDSGGTDSGGTDSGGTQAYAYQVQSMYVAYYGRAGDYDGVSWWNSALASSQGALEDIINAFGSSAEYENRFGDLSTAELITNLYLQMFGRTPEAEGLAWWTEEIDSGRVTLPEAAVRIAQGAQNNDQVVLHNRTVVAMRITEAIEQSDKSYQLDQIAQVKDFLQTVDALTQPDVIGLTALMDQLP